MRPLWSPRRLPGWRLLVGVLALLAGLVLPGAASADDAALFDEPLIPGLDSATDFQFTASGDVYVAQHDGTIWRFDRLAASTPTDPRYALRPQKIYKFKTTRQIDRGLVGIALDSQFDAGSRYLYALVTRGSVDYVDQRPGGNPNGIRRTAAVVRIRVPASGEASTADVTTIVGKDAPADPDSTCKPFTAGQAAANGETEAAPNGVALVDEAASNSRVPDFTERNVFPDGDLATRADGAYDCLPSDADTHGLGGIASLPDGTLMLTSGDTTDWRLPDGVALRTFNLESYVGKVLHVDRNGRGLAGHPFCPTETDLTRICTKVWAVGLRNAFRFTVLPPDSRSGGGPVLALADVGNYTMEHLAIARAGANLGWPCWEGDYYSPYYGSPANSTAPATAWGGPDLLPPAGANRKSCERLTAGGSGLGSPKLGPGITAPAFEYLHEQDAPGDEDRTPDGAAIVGGPLLQSVPGADPAIALPEDWDGSLVFGDYVRGWIQRFAADPDDPTNADDDGGLRLPADEGRSPRVQTDQSGDRQVDSLLHLVSPPPQGPGGLAPYFRLTMRQGPDGSLWYLRYGAASDAGGLYRLRTAPSFPAQIASVEGSCAPAGSPQTAITLTAADAGPDASYAWDTDGDGAPDRTTRSTTLTPAELPSLRAASGWVRLTVTVGEHHSTAARYICAGPTPAVTITAPADGAQVVLGQPVVVQASRAPGDAEATGIPDSDLRWKATTVHGSSHEHDLIERASPFETVDGEQRMQLTVTPDPGHELGSYTRVRIFAPQADGNAVAQTIRLVPKPVTVTLSSSPAGARMTMNRDGDPSVVGSAPGSFTAAAGAATGIAAGTTFTDAAGVGWRFVRWSDGPTAPSRSWQVPANGGTAPQAVYELDPDAPPPPTPPPTPTPAPQPTPPGVPVPPVTLAPPMAAPAPIALLPLTAPEVRRVPITYFASGVRSRTTTVTASIRLPRAVPTTALVVKVAVRDATCRWWSFGKKQFRGPSKRSARRAERVAASKACVRPPGWKLGTAKWSANGGLVAAPLGGKLKRGRYAVRLRVSSGRTVLAERVGAAIVR